MSGNHLREEISARADGEDPGIPDDEIERHIAACRACREYAESAHLLRRRMAMVEVPGAPERSRQLVESIGRDDRLRSPALTRSLLALCAVALIASSVPDFVSTDVGVHQLRHVAAFRLAYAIGLFSVVVRPARARTMLHISMVLVTALTATSVIDIVRGGLDLAGEYIHLVQVVAAVLLWSLTRPRRSPTGSPTTVERSDPVSEEPRDDRGTAQRILQLLDDDTGPGGRSNSR